MDLSIVINTALLCLFNVAFMVSGIFLNSVVIISLCRSSQLRKKLCYFTVLVLSCSDLVVVTIMHPLQISSTISAFLGNYNNIQGAIMFYIGVSLNGFSMFSLLVLNIERFLALSYPFFHQTSITKRRLMFLLVALMILFASLLLLSHLKFKIVRKVLPAIIIVFLVLFIYLNYKMFIIARSKRDNENVAKSGGRERIKPKFQFKSFSTCSLTVICYFVSSCPQLVNSALRLTLNRNTPHQELIFYNLWTAFVVSTNSTFNCLIFFWRNSILRREGMNTVKRFRKALFCQDCFRNEASSMER